MITPEEFWRRWGEEEFVHFSPDVVYRLHVPENAKQFLLQAGMPRQAEPFFVFDVAQSMLPTLPEHLPSYNLPPEYARYRLIAEKQHRWSDKINLTHFICLDEPTNGQVVCVLNRVDHPASLLNTSLLKFAEMLLIYQEHRQWIYSVSDWDPLFDSGELIQRQRDAVSALSKVDPEVLRPETVWYWIISYVKFSGLIMSFYAFSNNPIKFQSEVSLLHPLDYNPFSETQLLLICLGYKFAWRNIGTKQARRVTS